MHIQANIYYLEIIVFEKPKWNDTLWILNDWVVFSYSTRAYLIMDLIWTPKLLPLQVIFTLRLYWAVSGQLEPEHASRPNTSCYVHLFWMLLYVFDVFQIAWCCVVTQSAPCRCTLSISSNDWEQMLPAPEVAYGEFFSLPFNQTLTSTCFTELVF